MCSFDDVFACFGPVLLTNISIHCEDSMDRFVHSVSAIDPENPCDGALMSRLFNRTGLLATLMRCIHTLPSALPVELQGVLSSLTWPAIKNTVCDNDMLTYMEISDEAHEYTTPLSPPPGHVHLARSFFYLFFGATACALFAIRKNAMYRIYIRPKLVVAWWSVFLFTPPFLLWAMNAWTLPSEININGFFYNDENTRCAALLREHMPNAIVRDRFISFVLPADDAVATYQSILDTRIDGISLYDICGHCSLSLLDSKETDLVLNLMYNISTKHELTGNAVLLMLFPSYVTSSWRRAFTHAVSLAHPEILYSTLQQIQDDIMTTFLSEPVLAMFSIASVWSVLIAFICERDSILLDLMFLLACMSSLVACVVSSQSICLLLLGSEFTPFAVMLLPIVVGTGVDSILILMHYRRLNGRKWLLHAYPSIAASQVSTIACFVAGACLPIPHFHNFFEQAVVTILMSGSMQVTLFPIIVNACHTRKHRAGRSHTSPKGEDDALRIPYRFLFVVICVLTSMLFASIDMFGYDMSFSLKTQLSSNTMTYKYMEQTYFDRALETPVYAYLTSREDANFAHVDSVFRSRNITAFIDWHHAHARSSQPFEEWIRKPVNQIVFGPMMGKAGSNTSVVVGTSPFRMDGYAADESAFLTTLHGEDTEHVCFATYERLGGYTIQKVCTALWAVASISVVVSTAMGILISGRRGIATAAVLLYTYSGMAGIIQIMHVEIDMMVLIILFVSPGMIIDYTLHLGYNPKTAKPVLASYLSSVASAFPYTFSAVGGLRSFALVYMTFLTLGVCSALLGTLAYRYTSISHS